jgi:hypothetical protein
MRLQTGTPLFLGALLRVPPPGRLRPGGPRLSPDTVARAGDFSLQVEGAAQLLAPIQELPSDPEVVAALADFWVDYHLLALAVNREGELDRLDLGPVFRQQESQELVMRLRDAVIDEGDPPSDEEVEAFYLEERPGERVRARHILLLFPEGPLRRSGTRSGPWPRSSGIEPGRVPTSPPWRRSGPRIRGVPPGVGTWASSPGAPWCLPSRRPPSPWSPER